MTQATLAAKLDTLESLIINGDRRSKTALQHYRAGQAYFGALRDASFVDLKRVESGPFSSGAYAKARLRAEQARAHLALIEDLDDLGVCSSRDRYEAVAAEERAGMIFDALDDKRRWLCSKRCAPSKRRVVSDGRVRTGKYRIVDGVRVPIVRDVQ